ncbi:MAG: response regulator transcription factor [Acidimicrobiia bacterium]|nr:response regulator transcription factor [Acidimicrobiia bacterium]MDX2466443.1 response regulator transcription factor [Acidimicrobiia bacterium]
MFVAVYPAAPTQPLIAALLAAGYQPVPIDELSSLDERAPEGGWAAAVVEVTSDLGRAVALSAKIMDEYGLPVLLLIDRTMTADIAGEAGFSDFVLSPVDRTELRVRLGRLHSNSPAVADKDIIRFRDLELNTATYQATIAGEPRDLTFMEYELLRFLVENPGRVWSRDQILSRVWGYDYFGGSRTVDVHVRRLRAKLGEERASWITTVRSVGYRFG